MLNRVRLFVRPSNLPSLFSYQGYEPHTRTRFVTKKVGKFPHFVSLLQFH